MTFITILCLCGDDSDTHGLTDIGCRHSHVSRVPTAKSCTAYRRVLVHTEECEEMHVKSLYQELNVDPARPGLEPRTL